MPYAASDSRYQSMKYNRCGRSGVQLSAISLGLWQNFGSHDALENQRAMLRRAFDLGVLHFDLANNYGPEPGSAEENFGRLMKDDFLPYRDELFISSKSGYTMWPGPFGDWGSRKYLVASCDQSLKRMGLQYVDLFYSHRMDPNTPLEETMGALDYIVRSGRALYVGISNYDAETTARAVKILKDLGTPCLIHQPSYSMLNRWVEDGLLDVVEKEGIGCIPFSPLAQGLLTDKYLTGIPETSRAARYDWVRRGITPEKVEKVRKLSEIAHQRGQKMSQMALSWVLKDPRITSLIIGASKVSQIEDAVACLQQPGFSEAELQQIEAILRA